MISALLSGVLLVLIAVGLTACFTSGLDAEPQRKGIQMLVLTRGINESLVFDNRITVRVLGIRGNRVRLGIEAPPEVKVLRTELDWTGSIIDGRKRAEFEIESDNNESRD